jgi:MFS family permease
MAERAADSTDYRRAVAVLSVGQIVNWAALYYAFSSFVLPMQQALGWSKPALMGAFTLGLAVWGLSTVPAGAAIDRGYGGHVLAGGSALGGIGFLLWSQVDAPWMLYAAWCVLGVAMAMTLYEPAFAVLTRRYPTRFRDGITTLTLVGGFATTLSFPATTWLLHAFDWRTALAIIGAVLLFVIAPLHAIALRGDDGLAIDKEKVAAGSAAAAPTAASMADALRCGAFWLLAVTFACYSFAAAALWANVVPALSSKGLSETDVLAVLVWVGPTQVASRFLIKLAGNRLSPRGVGFVVYAMQAVAFLTFALASNTTGLIAFAMLFGAASGLAAVVRGSLVPEYFGRRHIGRIGGALSSLGVWARALAPIGAAMLLSWPMDYDTVMKVLAGLSLLSLLTYAAARKPKF